LNFDGIRRADLHLIATLVFLDFPCGANGLPLIVTLGLEGEVGAIIPPDEHDEAFWRGVIFTDVQKGRLAA